MSDAIPASFVLADVRIPATFTLAQHRAAEEVLLIFAERIGGGEDRPAPIACGWLAQRIGWRDRHGAWDKKSASRHLKSLVASGWLVESEPLPGRNGLRGTKTYLPGPAMTSGVVAVEDDPEIEPLGTVDADDLCPF